MHILWLLPVLPRVVVGFHQAPAYCRRQLFSTGCSGETTVACNNGPSWSPWRGEPGIFIRSGWVHEALVADHPDLSGFEVYMAGPPPMIDAGKLAFAERALPPEHLHFDSFEFAEPASLT